MNTVSTHTITQPSPQLPVLVLCLRPRLQKLAELLNNSEKGDHLDEEIERIFGNFKNLSTQMLSELEAIVMEIIPKQPPSDANNEDIIAFQRRMSDFSTFLPHTMGLIENVNRINIGILAEIADFYTNVWKNYRKYKIRKLKSNGKVGRFWNSIFSEEGINTRDAEFELDVERKSQIFRRELNNRYQRYEHELKALEVSLLNYSTPAPLVYFKKTYFNHCLGGY